jgi:benzoyl-CoA 2,3-dioxygenase component B
MLTEEAHHMFVGETGVLRIVERTASQMAEHHKEAPDEVRKLGVIDLVTIQKYLNLWFSLSLDLFGGEISSNAASFFATGLKGRAKEEHFEEHRALDATYTIEQPKGDGVASEQVPLRNAMNELLRDAYIEDCQRGVDKWNRAIQAHGVPFALTLPSKRFHRRIGIYGHAHADPSGNWLTPEQFDAQRDTWLPGAGDRSFVLGLMSAAITSPGQMAHYISAPKQGIKGRPVDFEYVRRTG